jgi:peroxiredoxin Q/BCP
MRLPASLSCLTRRSEVARAQAVGLRLRERSVQRCTQRGKDHGEDSFALAEALRAGPVVLYFYPAAFTHGCTIEAHDFAEATDRFKTLAATVIGVSHDSIDTLNKFSVSECRNKFAVASDVDQKISKSYDATLTFTSYSNRTSYVIAPDGRIIYAYSALNPDKHVENTLAAVANWRAAQKAPQAAP